MARDDSFYGHGLEEFGRIVRRWWWALNASCWVTGRVLQRRQRLRFNIECTVVAGNVASTIKDNMEEGCGCQNNNSAKFDEDALEEFLLQLVAATWFYCIGAEAPWKHHQLFHVMLNVQVVMLSDLQVDIGVLLTWRSVQNCFINVYGFGKHALRAAGVHCHLWSPVSEWPW